MQDKKKPIHPSIFYTYFLLHSENSCRDRENLQTLHRTVPQPSCCTTKKIAVKKSILWYKNTWYSSIKFSLQVVKFNDYKYWLQTVLLVFSVQKSLYGSLIIWWIFPVTLPHKAAGISLDNDVCRWDCDLLWEHRAGGGKTGQILRLCFSLAATKIDKNRNEDIWATAQVSEFLGVKEEDTEDWVKWSRWFSLATPGWFNRKEKREKGLWIEMFLVILAMF